MAFSLTLIIFNFLAFLFIAVAYVKICHTTLKNRPTHSNQSNSGKNIRKYKNNASLFRLKNAVTKDGSTLRYAYNLRTTYFVIWSVPYQRTVLCFYFENVPYQDTVRFFAYRTSSLNQSGSSALAGDLATLSDILLEILQLFH